MKKLHRSVPLLLWASLITYMSSQDAVSVSSERTIDIFTHKLAHLIEYSILYIAYLYAIYQLPIRNFTKLISGIIFIGIFGAIDEIHQSFNPTRSPRISDVFVDIVGGVVGYIFSRIYISKRKII